MRAAVPDQDLQGVIELNRLVQDIHVAAEPSQFRPSDDMPGIEEFHLGFMAGEGRYTFVAEVGTTLAGYVSLEYQRRPAHTFALEHTRLYVHQISVHPRFRRHGVGRALMSRVETLGIELGVSEVRLDTWKFNDEALHFFEALGYTPYNLRLRKRGT